MKRLPLALTAGVALFRCLSFEGLASAAELGSQQVTPYYGSFGHVIPIEVPAFRGLEPGLAVAYSSEARNGFVGVGWNLAGFSQIERVNAGRGSTAFAASDVYLLDGQEMFACPPGSQSPSCTSGGTHAFKIENYLKVAFISGSNTWTVWARNGTRFIYTPLIQTSGGTLRWGKTSAIDTKNNTVTYTWACVEGDCYPATVSYNGYTIALYRELRPDVLSFPAYDGVNRTKYRLRSIIQSVSGNTIRAYKLSYTTSPLTGRSLLASVQQFGKDVVHDGNGLITGGSSLPAMTFTYRDDAIGRSFVSEAAAPPTPAGTVEPVRWASRVYAYAYEAGNSLYKESGGNGWTAGAISTRSIMSGDGYMEFTARSAADANRVMAGLSNGNTDATYQDIDFAIYEIDGQAHVYESGVLRAGPFPIAAGDKLRVEVQGGVVRYKRNSALLYTSTLTPVFPLQVDTSLNRVFNIIREVVISGALQDSSHWCSTWTLLTADVNSDGRTDQLCYQNTYGGGVVTGGRVDVRLATADGFQAPQSWLAGYAFNQIMTADVNGDGRTDLVDYETWNGEFFVALGNASGTGFNAPTSWGTAVAVFEGSQYQCRYNPETGPGRTGAGDYNGDGIADITCKLFGRQEIFVGLSNGVNAFNFSIFGRGTCEIYERTGTLDFNGDGKDDWFCIGMTNHTMWVFPSNGTSFDSWSGSLTSTFCSEPGYVLGDVNGDGRTDAVCKDNGKVALSSGRLFVEQATPSGGWCSGGTLFAAEVDGDTASELICDNAGAGATDIQVRQWNDGGLTSAETWKANWCASRVLGGDFNGDGKTDLLCDSLAVPVALAGSSGVIADLALTLTNGIGGSVQLAYGVGTSFPNTNVAKQVITSLTTLDGRGGSSTNTYQYADGRMDARERRFLGFGSTWEMLPCLPGETGTNCPRIWRLFRQDLASAGQLEKMRVWTDATYHSRAYQYEFTTSAIAGTLRSIVTAETVVTLKDDTPGCPTWPCADGKRAYTTHAYDAFGNQTQTTHFGDYDISGDETTEQRIFYPNTTNYIVGGIGRHRTFAGTTTGGALLKDLAYRYDGAASETVPPTQGYPTMARDWLVEQSRWISRSFGYDGWGNPTSATDATSRTTTRAFDSGYHVFPVSESNNAGETETASWDPVCGLPSSHTDANLRATVFQPGDVFCRATRVDSPLGGFEIRSYLALGNPALQRVRLETPSASPADGSGNDFREVFFDGAGRVWRRVRKGAGPGQVILEDSAYNVRGSISSTTTPYYGSGTPPYAASEPSYTTTFAYDALDRRTSTHFTDTNQVATAYGLFSETRIDEHLHETTTRYDVFGRKVRAERELSGQVYATQFAYDLLGRLTGMADPLSNSWSWTFDSLGRNTAKNDPDAGTWTFGYDDAGRLVTQLDAKTQRTDFSYDPAGRPSLKRTFTSVEVPEHTVTTTYGEPRAGYFNVGRVTSIADPGTSTLTVDHDAAGRVVRQVRTVDSTSYNTTLEYDAGSRLKILRYSLGLTPGAITASYTYDAAGRVKSLTDLIASITYDAAGRPLLQGNVNQTTTERTYSPPRGFLTGILTTVSTGGAPPPIQNLVYTPDPAGMLVSVTSPFDRESWTYGYDDGHRVTSASSPSPPMNRTFQYDEIDRMTFNSRFGAYTYPPLFTPRPHAPTDIAGRGAYSYDANGNLSTGGGLTLAWNVSNQSTLITASSASTTFEYGGGGDRVKKTHAGATTIYPFGDDFEISGGIATRYISVPGLGVVAKLVGDESNPTRFWLHTDRLGSIQAVTNAAGVEVLRRSYEAYGDRIQDSTGHVESRGYIDQREDETGLIYLHARYYDPALGIFISPDPTHPTMPGVGLNRYVYGFGNPVNGTDGSGRWWHCVTSNDHHRQRADGSWETIGNDSTACYWVPEPRTPKDPLGGWTPPGGGDGGGGGGGGGRRPVKPQWLDLKNLLFLIDFVTGGGGTNLVYSSDTVESQEMQQSPGADFGLDEFVAANCQTTQFEYRTPDAAMDTIFNPLYNTSTFDADGTPTQVGGFMGTVTNNGDGTVTFDIENRAGRKSFFYHGGSDRTGTTGPFRTINQSFRWTESLPGSCR